MNKIFARIAIVALIVVPVAIFFILRQGKIVVNYVPIMGERSYDEVKKDTVYHTVPKFSFIDQTGQQINEHSFDNQVYIANFFFATCKDVCPKMQGTLRSIYEKYEKFQESGTNKPFLKFISHTVDPENDSVPVLKKYADALKVNSSIWHFVTGKKSEIYSLGVNGYLLATGEDEKVIADSLKFFHSRMLVLIDKEKRIRGAYDSHNPNDINHLEDDIRMLLYEYNEKHKK